jgi:hypothetical protein
LVLIPDESVDVEALKKKVKSAQVKRIIGYFLL